MTETKCPICHLQVKKVKETDSIPEGKSICGGNEYYQHIGNLLIKFKNPVGAWEHNLDTLSNTELLTTKTDISGQNTVSGI